MWLTGQRDPTGTPDRPTGEWVVARVVPAIDSVAAVIEVHAGSDMGTTLADLAVSPSSVWMATQIGVMRIDVASNAVAAIYAGVTANSLFRIGEGGIAVSSDFAYFASVQDGKLYRLPLDG